MDYYQIETTIFSKKTIYLSTILYTIGFILALLSSCNEGVSYVVHIIIAKLLLSLSCIVAGFGTYRNIKYSIENREKKSDYFLRTVLVIGIIYVFYGVVTFIAEAVYAVINIFYGFCKKGYFLLIPKEYDFIRIVLRTPLMIIFSVIIVLINDNYKRKEKVYL